MEKIVLNANKRDIYGKKLPSLRSEGKTPAIVYGNKKDNLAITLDSKEFSNAFSRAGYSAIMDLKIEGEDTPVNVLIYDVDIDPLTNQPRHADFYRVNMNEKIRTEVPLHFIGESPAVFQQEGSLFKNIEEIEVETLPANLPSHIEVDISGLDDFSKSIHVSDLKIPDGVELLVDSEQLVCKAEPPRSEEEMAALDEEVGEAIPEGADEEAGSEESTEEKPAEEAAKEPEAK